MLSSIVKMPTSMMMVTTTAEKRPSALSWDHRPHSCCINMNNDEKPAAVANYQFPGLINSPAASSSCCLRTCFAATRDSAVATNVEKVAAAGIQLPGGLHPELMPKHVAIIMDGHGRWAEKRGLPTEKGHLAGQSNLKRLALSACTKFRIKALTVYAFSTENWSRSQAEIDCLMRGYEDVIRSYVMEVLIPSHDLRFSVIGDKSRLPPSIQAAISEAEESSRGNDGMHLVMAMSYSGRLDITEASRKIASKVEDGILGAKDITDDIVEQHLMTSMIEVPEPDLLIRTSGEMRVSNFLLWQLAYTEFYFVNKMFPELDEDDLVEAMACFQGRKRRFGGRASTNN